MRRILLFVCTLFLSTFLLAQEQTEENLETIEIHAYIQQAQIPQYAPIDCPQMPEKVADDILASEVLGTIMYELINFWGHDPIEGTAGGYSDKEAVFWKIIKSNGDDYEVIMKTQSVLIGKKVYAQMEEQQAQECFQWGLVFSNEEVEVLVEAEEDELVIADDFSSTPTSYEQYDPYATENYELKNTQNFADNDAYAVKEDRYSDPTLFDDTYRDFDQPNNSLATNNPVESYDGNADYQRREDYNDARRAFSAMMPAASTEITLPLDFFTSIETIGEVERLIANSLEARGYSNKGYFEFDNGFMIATQMEAINSNGTSKNNQYRWPSRIVFNQSLSFTNYLSSLFVPERGKYRMFVFYVEAAPNRVYTDFDEIDYSVASQRSFYDKDRSPLPDGIANLPYRHKNGLDSNVKVLVYETQTGGGERRPNLLLASSMSAREHLMKSGLWNMFSNR